MFIYISSICLSIQLFYLYLHLILNHLHLPRDNDHREPLHIFAHTLAVHTLQVVVQLRVKVGREFVNELDEVDLGRDASLPQKEPKL